jgi:hypothetical protein
MVATPASNILKVVGGIACVAGVVMAAYDFKQFLDERTQRVEVENP